MTPAERADAVRDLFWGVAGAPDCPDYRALVRGVEADPRAPAPRLALADWLTERGRPGLARRWLDGTACVCGGARGGFTDCTDERMAWVACPGFACRVPPGMTGYAPATG